MKLKRYCLILVALFTTLAFGADDLATYKGKSAAQLSAMTDYQTIPNTSYWNNHAYAQIAAAINAYYSTANDTGSIRYVKAYGAIDSAVYNNTTAPVSGFVFGWPSHRDYKTSTTLMTSGLSMLMPTDYVVDWRNRRWQHKLSSGATEFGNVMFYASLDTGITISGGEYDGHSYDNYTTGDIASTNATSTKANLSGITVVADSLIKWYIRITAGTGSGQTRRIESNEATAAGVTVITNSVAWVTPPDATSDYSLIPMEEYQSGFDFNKCKRVTIANAYIHDFPGDGIVFTGCTDVTVTNCTIINPLRWYYTGSATNYQNLVGRQGITLSGGTSGNWYDRPDTTAKISGLDTLRNITISHCNIRGGYPGGIDLEPLGRCYVENLEISDCLIENTPGQGGVGIIISVDDSTVIKNLIIRNNVIRSDGYGIWIQNAAQVKLDSTNTAEAIDATEYEWLVDDADRFTQGDYIMVGDNLGFFHIDGIDGSNLQLDESGGVRTAYNGVANTTHALGTKIYRMSGLGSDYGYMENVVIEGNTIIPHTVGTGSNGLYFPSKNVHHLRIAGNFIANWDDRGLWLYDTYATDVDISNNRFYNNGNNYGLSNQIYAGNVKAIKLENNIYKDNGIVTADSSGNQMYITTASGLVAKGNVFICSDEGTIDRGLNLYACDSVIVHYNVSYGHGNDDIGYYAVTNARIENNTAGFSASGTADSTSADMTYEYGTSEPGDTTAALHMETKRVTFDFGGYRDSYGRVTGAKIVARSTGEYNVDDPWRVQKTHLEFYTLDMLPLGLDRSRIRSIITGNGLGLVDSSYLCWFPANSATVVSDPADPDTLYRYIGENGYGFRDSSGTIQYKNSGGSWANVGSAGGGAGDVVGPASSTDNAVVRFDGTTGKLLQSNSYVKMLDSGATGWGLGSEDPVVWVTVNPTLETGVLVTDEAVPAMTDSCAGMGVASGAGFVKLYSGNGNNSTITTDNNDYLIFKDATGYVMHKKAGAALMVTSENVPALSDSSASLYTYLGNGALLLNSTSSTKTGIIYQSSADGMRFINADKYKFSANIEADAGVVFNSKTADPTSGTGMFIRNVTPTNLDTLITRDASGNLTRWYSGGLSITIEGEVQLADDEIYALPSSVNGWAEAMSSLNGEFIRFRFSNNGVTTLLSDCSTNTSGSNTDATLCAYDAGDHVALRNRLGSPQYVKYVIHYSAN